MRLEDGVQVCQDTTRLWKRAENLRDAFDPAVSSPAGRRDTSNDNVIEEGKRTPLLCRFVQQMIVLPRPRQARDKHNWRNSKKEIRVFSEEIEFEVLEEDEEELSPAAAAAVAAAVGFAGAASAGVVRALKRSLLPRGQRSVYRELARLHCAIVAKRQHARTPYIEDLCLHVLPHKVEKQVKCLLMVLLRHGRPPCTDW